VAVRPYDGQLRKKLVPVTIPATSGRPGDWYDKTHSVPKQITDDPVIWTCRDGRNAISALARFYGVRAYELILGQNIFFADWTTFYRAWNPLNRPNTLVLHYEQLCEDTEGQIQRISDFLMKPIVGEFKSRRDEAHKWYPQLFKRTPTKYQEVMTADEQELFWEFHGQTMKDLGYVDERAE